MLEFQIKENYGNNCGGLIYFAVSDGEISEEDLTAYAQRTLKNRKSTSRPKITITQLFEGKPLRNGINFKTCWK